MVDWTDRKYRTLSELAQIAFPPDAGVTAEALKRLVRRGKLTAYRPGKQYISTLADVHAMIEASATKPK